MSDTNRLITVKKTTGDSKAFYLDTSAKLDEIRQQLKSEGFMTDQDYFLIGSDGTQVAKSQERIIPLSALIGENDAITIGVENPISSIANNDGVERYNLLNDDQKRGLFNNIQIYRGLTMTESLGFAKTFKDLVSWQDDQLPVANQPRILTEVQSHFSFSKVTHEMTVFGVDKASVSFSSPFLTARSEYEHEKKNTENSSLVTEYLTAKYIARKVSLSIASQILVVNSQFLVAVRDAIENNENNINGYANLLEVLNEWGYYVPLEFTLGGVLYSKKSKQISEFSQAEEEKQTFSASFEATFKQIGGGAAYSNAQGSSSNTTETNQYEETSIQQIGGRQGTTNDYNEWIKSLDTAINWDVSYYNRLFPSLALLKTDMPTLNKCIRLINNFSSYHTVADRQPYLDMKAYATNIEAMFNPWA